MQRALQLVRWANSLWSEYSLEENYWAHVEMFPATASKYSATALNELVIILLNARAGELKSISIPLSGMTGDEQMH